MDMLINKKKQFQNKINEVQDTIEDNFYVAASMGFVAASLHHFGKAGTTKDALLALTTLTGIFFLARSFSYKYKKGKWEDKLIEVTEYHSEIYKLVNNKHNKSTKKVRGSDKNTPLRRRSDSNNGIKNQSNVISFPK